MVSVCRDLEDLEIPLDEVTRIPLPPKVEFEVKVALKEGTQTVLLVPVSMSGPNAKLDDGKEDYL